MVLDVPRWPRRYHPISFMPDVPIDSSSAGLCRTVRCGDSNPTGSVLFAWVRLICLGRFFPTLFWRLLRAPRLRFPPLRASEIPFITCLCDCYLLTVVRPFVGSFVRYRGSSAVRRVCVILVLYCRTQTVLLGAFVSLVSQTGCTGTPIATPFTQLLLQHTDVG